MARIGQRTARGAARHCSAVALLAGLLLLGACGSDAPPPDELRMGVAQGPLTLDPRRATDATSARVARLVYQALVDLGPDYRPAPALATWVQPDPLHYRFSLIGTPRFHDGTPLTAGDVVATYTSLLGPGAVYPLRGEFTALAGVRALDGRTIEFRLRVPDPWFVARLTLGILPRQAALGAFRPLGSGPFRVLNDNPEQLLLVRDDGMRLRLRAVPDPLVRTLLLRHGTLDLIQNDLPAELWAYLDAQPGVRLLRMASSNYHYVGVNCRDGLAGQAALRQALSLALDRDAIARALLGPGVTAARTVLPPGHWAGLAPGALPVADPAAARRLLESAGLAGTSLTLKTSTDPQRVRIASALQAQWRAVGLRVRLESVEWGTFYADIQAGRFQLYTLAWVGVTQPDMLRSLYHRGAAPPAGLNRGACGSAPLDAAIDRALASTQAGQARLLRVAQRQALRELPALPLWKEPHIAAVGPRVRGYHLRTDGAFDALKTVSLNGARDSH